MTSPESVFTYGEPQLKFGMGAADESTSSSASTAYAASWP
jgi:hypothetical protein